MSELKPCPFCGSEAGTYKFILPGEIVWLAYCPNENCHFSHRTASIADWNTRPIEDALNKRIAELEAERDEAQKMYERLMNTAFYYETILPNGNLGVNVLEVCEGRQEAHEEIVRLYRWVERLIEAGHAMSNVAEWRYTNLTELMAWDNLVAEWKEREK